MDNVKLGADSASIVVNQPLYRRASITIGSRVWSIVRVNKSSVIIKPDHDKHINCAYRIIVNTSPAKGHKGRSIDRDKLLAAMGF